MEQVRQISRNKLKKIQSYRSSGKHLCGYVSSFIPEEMIHASGMIPVRVKPKAGGLKQADSLLQTFVCEHTRGCLEAGLAGDYSVLDGIVFTRTCDAIRNLYTIWVNNIPSGFKYYLSTPGNTDKDAVNYFREELEKFRRFLEERRGSAIIRDSLAESITLYNQNRHLMRSLATSDRFSGTDLFHLYNSATVMSPDDLYSMLKSIDPELMVVPEKTVRLAVTGSHFSDPDIIAVLEQLGAHVVILDLEIGLRRFWVDVNENCDPLEALAYRYLGSALDPSKYPGQARRDLLISLLDLKKVDGLVVMNQKYCDPYLFEEPRLKRILDKKTIPSLFLTVGEELDHRQQFINRIQAFLEIIAAR